MQFFGGYLQLEVIIQSTPTLEHVGHNVNGGVPLFIGKFGEKRVEPGPVDVPFVEVVGLRR